MFLVSYHEFHQPLHLAIRSVDPELLEIAGSFKSIVMIDIYVGVGRAVCVALSPPRPLHFRFTKAPTTSSAATQPNDSAGRSSS